MANIKDTVDKFSNAKDIAERQQIIYDYRTYGKIDRANAINKIMNCVLQMNKLLWHNG